MSIPDRSQIEVFSSSPPSRAYPWETPIQQVIGAASWSEQAGCSATLVYTDNSVVDPWLVSRLILQNTEGLCSLVAIQPLYLHPYAVAKMVAGGFKNDLVALNDTPPHDERCTRLVEYTTIIKLLFSSPVPVTFEVSSTKWTT
jgi:alkanesulfonate monooxygenase